MLFEAVQNGDVQKVSSLLDDGIDVNTRDDKFFNTALHRSIFASGNRYQLVDLLISRGADCNALNKKFLTASELALEKKLDDLAKHMILRETERIENHLAYYLLIRRGNLQLFEFLISIKRLKYEDEIQIIARAYAELKLKNVPLKEHMEAYLNEILINHDYWLINNNGRGKQGKVRVQNVHRVREIVENVQQLFAAYDNYNLMDVDSIFLLRLSYILENVFFIRNHYKELPLHHVEFCIAIFLHIWKSPPHYEIYKMFIDKRQLLTYLGAITNELKKIIALPCYNLTPPPSPQPTATMSGTPASPTGASNSTDKPHTRFWWTSELNRELLFCFYVVTTGGQHTIGYRRRLHDLWCNRQATYNHLTEQNLFSQLRKIQRDHLLTEDVGQKALAEASQYGFDYHCSRTRPVKISDKNRKVFRRLAKSYSKMKELHSINRAMAYVNSVVDMKFNPSREIDVLAMKRVVQVLCETIRTSKDTPNVGKHIVSFLNVLTPRYLLGDTKARHYLSHCRRDFSSLLETADEEIDYAELHRNLKILRNLLLYVQNLEYILAVKTLMNRLYDSKCLEEIKSYYAYIFRHNSKDLMKDFEFAPFLLLELDSILEAISAEQCTLGFKPSDRIEKMKALLREEIDSYKFLHQHFSNAMLMVDCIVSKIKSNHSYEKIRHLLRSHLRVFQLNRKVTAIFLNHFKSELVTFLYHDLKLICDEHNQTRVIFLVTAMLFAINNHSVDRNDMDLHFQNYLMSPLFDNYTIREGRTVIRKAKDHPEKRSELLHHCLQKHQIPFNGSSFQKFKRNDEKVSEEKISQLQNLFLDPNMNLRTFDRIEEIAFEMAMLEATWALSSKLLNNAESLSNYVPVLTGRNLRNYLTRGSVTYEVLIPNISSKTIVQNALSIIKLSKNIISEIYERHCWDFQERLECLRYQMNILDGFRFQSCDEIRDTIKQDQYLIGKDHLSFGIVDRLIQTQSCLLLGHLLDLSNIDELLKVLSYLLDDVKVISCGGYFYDFLKDISSRIRFCYQLALLSNEEDILLKIVSDFGHEQIDSISMIFNFDQMFISFLENHADYDVNTDLNVDILHCAVLSGNIELLNLLLDQCNDLNQRNACNLTPLDVACKLSNVEMMKTLTNAGAKWFTNDLSQYTWLFLNNDHEAIIFLKNNDLIGDKIAKSCINLFLQFCEDDKEEIVEFMLNSVDYSHLYPVAAKFRRMHVLRYMIANDRMVKVNINRRDCNGQTALHVSIMNGFREVVVLLLSHHGNPQIVDSAGNTPLHLAVQNCDVKIVKLLLKHHSHIDTKNVLNMTPLDLAVEKGHLGIIKLLLRRIQPTQMVRIPEIIRSLDLLNLLKISNVQYKLQHNQERRFTDSLTPLHYAKEEREIRILLRYLDGDICSPRFLDTPLHLACLVNNLNAVSTLLAQGANPNLTNCDNLTALDLAVINQNIKIVRTVIPYLRQPYQAQINAAFEIAVRKQNLEIATLLLENGADISILRLFAKQPTLLHTAARHGFVKILQYILQERLFPVNDEDSTGSTALFHAVISANIETVECLLKHGADVTYSNKSGQNVISTATMFGELDIVKYFINNFPEIARYVLLPHVGQNTSLHIAVLKESIPMVRYFIKLHKDNQYSLNGQNQEGFTAIHICAQTGNEQIFWLLLEHGADPTIPLTNGQSILHTAASNNHLNIVRIILGRSLIDVNAVDCNQRTILHYAVFSKSATVVRLILKIRGLKTDRQDCNGNTALHLAAESQYIDIYNMLQKRVGNELSNYNRKRAIDVLLKK
ncbi:uncharacterized protein LOC131678826 [Topomyia yanbarensis]|uniref:uncharacterized protein LOC131678826 n=1 Tax=Topomyia yanbarensis TaxID=2498891 RepID=UPI00273CD3E7|nr:uncharacterized protein LOC131678826 [Topomyia yanbarensis]XP_058815178.1 uncharacterized protein LOC131678826 [Topomyia yanbarensis]XP_058815179.1 uncharacterized protein LOC131678826 [Topomyia yanbarensis]XP_058815180.1 uncharacterized protein LOC131678826 [Topomyia yanbarensis]